MKDVIGHVCFLCDCNSILMGFLASELDMVGVQRHFWQDSWKHLEDPNGDLYGAYLEKVDEEQAHCR